MIIIHLMQCYKCKGITLEKHLQNRKGKVAFADVKKCGSCREGEGSSSSLYETDIYVDSNNGILNTFTDKNDKSKLFAVAERIARIRAATTKKKEKIDKNVH